MCSVSLSARSRRVTSKPSISGMRRSTSTSVAPISLAISTAIDGWLAKRKVYAEHPFRPCEMMSSAKGSSSIRRMVQWAAS